MEKTNLSWTITKKEHFTRTGKLILYTLSTASVVLIIAAISLWQEMGAKALLVVLVFAFLIAARVFFKKIFFQETSYNLTEEYVEVVKKHKKEKYYWNEIKKYADLGEKAIIHPKINFLNRNTASTRKEEIFGKRFSLLLETKGVIKNPFGSSVVVQAEPDNQTQVEEMLKKKIGKISYGHSLASLGSILMRLYIAFNILAFAIVMIIWLIAWLLD